MPSFKATVNVELVHGSTDRCVSSSGYMSIGIEKGAYGEAARRRRLRQRKKGGGNKGLHFLVSGIMTIVFGSNIPTCHLLRWFTARNNPLKQVLNMEWEHN